MVFRIVQRCQAIVERGLWKASTLISRWTKPVSHAPVLGTITDLVRSKPQLLAERMRQNSVWTARFPDFSGILSALNQASPL
ncbi:MAG: hypothetical protein NVS2B7_36200 [Herpetosiphon sp.]